MSSIQILWVDDEIELLKPHILFLERKNYKVTTCTNGADAIDLVDEENFDIVWSDYNIVWTFEYSKDDTLNKSNLNRSSGELVEENFYGDKSLFKKETGLHSQKAKYKCQLSEKLF